MYFKYATYQFDANVVERVATTRRRTTSPRGWQMRELRRLTLDGTLIADGQSAVETAVAALEAAFIYDGKGDAALYQDDGTITSHKLSNDDSLSGVMVKSLDFPGVDQGAAPYATGRTFRIVLEATYDVSVKQVVAFHEYVHFRGTTGPKWRAVELWNGPAYQQMIARNSVQRVVQSGTAKGLDGYPIYPGPLFPPVLEHLDLREQRMQGPTEFAGNFQGYGIFWKYVFSSGSPLIGTPHNTHIG